MKTQAKTLYPFVPSGSDFSQALAFFEDLGFTKVWGDDSLAGLRFGGAYFLLQNINVPVWQENQMLTYEVDDLEGYWQELQEAKLTEKYPGVRLKPPTDYPWGREIHIIDPGGVCWHVRGVIVRESDASEGN
jgi:hypothetical protein